MYWGPTREEVSGLAPRIKLRTGGHSDKAIEPAFKMLEKVFSDKRLDLGDREVTISYAGREQGDGRRSPLAVRPEVATPSGMILLTVQPQANDTCTNYRAVAKGLSKDDFEARVRSFCECVERNRKGNYQILTPEELATKTLKEMLVDDRATDPIDGPVVVSATTVTKKEMAPKPRRDAGGDPVRHFVVERLREAGAVGIKSAALRKLVVAEFPEVKDSVAVIVGPLVADDTVLKVGSFYMLPEFVKSEDEGADAVALGDEQIREFVRSFLSQRPDGEAASEHVRQQINTDLAQDLSSTHLKAILEEMKDAGVIESVPNHRGRYRLVAAADPAVFEQAEPKIHETPPTFKDGCLTATVDPVAVLDDVVQQVRAVPAGDAAVADVLLRVGELLISLSELVRRGQEGR